MAATAEPLIVILVKGVAASLAFPDHCIARATLCPPIQLQLEKSYLSLKLIDKMVILDISITSLVYSD